MTASIGFRSPERSDLAREMLARLADTEAAEGSSRVLYRDPAEQATATPARIPASLERFATEAVARALRERGALQAVLGEALTEPKRNTFFDATDTAPSIAAGLELDPRSRMMYDARHVFLNGESWRAGGRDARLLRRLADARRLSARELRSASGAALALLGQWVQEGWLHSSGPSQDEERAP